MTHIGVKNYTRRHNRDHRINRPTNRFHVDHMPQAVSGYRPSDNRAASDSGSPASRILACAFATSYSTRLYSSIPSGLTVSS